MRLLLLIALVTLLISACDTGDVAQSQGTVTGGNSSGLQGVQWDDDSITVERHLPSDIKKGDIVCFNREAKTITKGACP